MNSDRTVELWPARKRAGERRLPLSKAETRIIAAALQAWEVRGIEIVELWPADTPHRWRVRALDDSGVWITLGDLADVLALAEVQGVGFREARNLFLRLKGRRLWLKSGRP